MLQSATKSTAQNKTQDTANSTTPNDVVSQKSANISAKLERLEALTSWFYGDDFSLDQALAKFQNATKLAAEIQADLANLRNQVEIIHEDFTKS